MLSNLVFDVTYALNTCVVCGKREEEVHEVGEKQRSRAFMTLEDDDVAGQPR
jgi:hypothetical protein